MLDKDREALICDMAESYHIYEIKDFPAYYIAMLAAGLSEDRRIKRKLSESKTDKSTYLQAMQVDLLQYLLWSKTKDAQHGRNKPELITEKLTHKNQKETASMSIEEFNRARSRVIHA